ncbi:MAG: S8 family serine peptidase [Geodermatophilaceae bacterium]|nr:S8 family serine peptidase [Geodermatophilaceae bacterium]
MRRCHPLAGRIRVTLSVLALSGLVLGSAGPATAAPVAADPDLTAVSDAVRAATTLTGAVAPSLRGATGPVQVSVRLSEVPLAAFVTEGATAAGGLPTAAAQRARNAAVRTQQDGFLSQARALGARELGRSVLAANVVAVRVDAGRLADLARIPGVLSVKPVAEYETHDDPSESGSLAQAAQYVEAESVWADGFSGDGVSIAVLDSGVDYTHRNLGGPGSVLLYNQCYRNNARPPGGLCGNYFGPDAPKVIGGYDFVGEEWPLVEDLSPDPNPIDFDGHGTHVADAAAGNSADDAHRGIAYGADVYAVKVCSSVSPSCSGVALLQGIDFALDPNGDGDISDAVDVINMSLGSSYGQPQDDLSLASDNAVRAGVVVVASAGNGADRPFIVGSPSTASRVISVAQTALPDDVLYPIEVISPVIPELPDNTIRFAVLQTWSPVPEGPISGDLAQPVDNEGCEPADFAAFPAGSIALIKRGTCAASQKAQNAQDAAATAVIIWNNVPGDPPSFSFGGGEPVVIPTLTISLANGELLAEADADGTVTVLIDPAEAISLTNTVVGSTSRGPRIQDGAVKPDIGAPGAWLSAEVGTGNGETNFGGTSGAAPIVSGAAALLIDKFPNAAPPAIKSRLLNGASTENSTPDTNAFFYPTPISRIGAGEVRVAPSADATGVLANTQVGNGNLSYGLPRLTTQQSYPVRLLVGNTGGSNAVYDLEAVFRDPSEAASGAVRLDLPASVSVPAGQTRSVTATLVIDPAKLPKWPFAGEAGVTGDGSALNGPEYDGFVLATSASETLHLGWQVLPRRSADVTAEDSVAAGSSLTVTNTSTVQTGTANIYGLTGTSPVQPPSPPGGPGTPGSNQAVIDLTATGVRDSVAGDVLQFALAGAERQTVPLYPAGYEVDIDVDQDGEVDYAVFQQEETGFAATGRSLVYVLDVATGVATAYYYNIADFDASTQVFTVPLSALGLSRGDTFDFSVLAFDNYFSGLVTDVIDGMSWTVGKPRYVAAFGLNRVLVPAGSQVQVPVASNPRQGPSSQTGLLMLYDNNKSQDSQAVTVTGG